MPWFDILEPSYRHVVLICGSYIMLVVLAKFVEKLMDLRPNAIVFLVGLPTVFYTSYAIALASRCCIDFLRTVLYLISLTLIFQALSANFDPIIGLKDCVIVQDVGLVLLSIMTLISNPGVYLGYYAYLVLTIMLVVLSLPLIAKNFPLTSPLIFVLISCYMLNGVPVFIHIPLSALFIAYIQGYARIVRYSTITTPYYDNVALFATVLTIVVSSVLAYLATDLF